VTVRRALESIQWGLFCTSSWTWCIGMYLPFILLRLWGWPGFWAFFVPNVLGCAAFGFVLDRDRSRAMVARLGWMCALFGAVTIAYQAYFAGWAAQYLVIGTRAPGGELDALRTVVSTGAPIVVLVAGFVLALRGDGFWRTAGTVVSLASALVVLLPGGVDPAIAAGDQTARHAGGPALLGGMPLAWALPTIAAGFLLSPYFDLTFHRAVQQAPEPRIAFATFGLSFAAMLLLIASFYDALAGAPRIGVAIVVLWALQLTFTVGAHLRELLFAAPGVRIPAKVTAGLAAFAVLLATPACLFTLGPALPDGWLPLLGGVRTMLLPGEPAYLAFLGAYGLLFPVLFLLEAQGVPRAVTIGVLVLGLPCYLLGAFDFRTELMPVPIVAALALAAWHRAKRPAMA
jgi:hypothetical protein